MNIFVGIIIKRIDVITPDFFFPIQNLLLKKKILFPRLNEIASFFIF